jgi:NAD(P)-dependent dehydrogenase (short-subunit alcohol dehydrogenase family)
MRFNNQVAVVTGAAKGIGAAVVRAYQKEGAKVVLLDLDVVGQDLAEELGEGALFIQTDVANSAAVEKAFAQVKETWGGVDLLVNNAGVQHYGSVTETTEEQWDRVMAVNLKSAFLCAKYGLPLMQARGKGVVVNVSSVQAFLSQNNVAPYTTSKTALLGLTRSIAVDYAPQVRCVAVCPGTVDTPMLHWAIEQSPNPAEILRECQEMHPLKRIATPEEVAKLILFLSSEDAGFMTGQYYRVDGGLGLSIGGSKKS